MMMMVIIRNAKIDSCGQGQFDEYDDDPAAVDDDDDDDDGQHKKWES